MPTQGQSSKPAKQVTESSTGWSEAEFGSFVAMQFVLVFVFQRGLFDFLHRADDEIARADKRIEDVNAGRTERFAEFFLQNFFDAANHKVHNGLRRVHDAVRVGDLDRKSLKELFVNGIQKILFLREIFNRRGGGFDGAVKVIELAQKGVAVESLRSQRVNHPFDFRRDDVAAGEIGIVENLRKMRSVNRC